MKTPMRYAGTHDSRVNEAEAESDSQERPSVKRFDLLVWDDRHHKAR